MPAAGPIETATAPALSASRISPSASAARSAAPALFTGSAPRAFWRPQWSASSSSSPSGGEGGSFGVSSGGIAFTRRPPRLRARFTTAGTGEASVGFPAFRLAALSALSLTRRAGGLGVCFSPPEGSVPTRFFGAIPRARRHGDGFDTRLETRESAVESAGRRARTPTRSRVDQLRGSGLARHSAQRWEKRTIFCLAPLGGWAHNDHAQSSGAYLSSKHAGLVRNGRVRTMPCRSRLRALALGPRARARRVMCVASGSSRSMKSTSNPYKISRLHLGANSQRANSELRKSQIASKKACT